MRDDTYRNKLATVTEAAKRLGCSRFMIYYMMRNGYLSAVSFPAGKRMRRLIFRDSLDLVAEKMKEEDWYPQLLKDARAKQRKAASRR